MIDSILFYILLYLIGVLTGLLIAILIKSLACLPEPPLPRRSPSATVLPPPVSAVPLPRTLLPAAKQPQLPVSERLQLGVRR